MSVKDQGELPEMLGRIRWFNNEHGHGMATGEDGYEFFLHYSEFVERANGWRVMCYEGQTVKFIADLSNPRGPRAKNIEVINADQV